MKPELHLFDFDGTITSKDSLLNFAQFVVGPIRSKCYMALIVPVISLMKLGVLKRANVKVMFLRLNFKGLSKDRLSNLAQEYLERSTNNQLFRPKALEKIRDLRQEGHRICIVSASLDIWLRPIADYFQADLLCTKAEIISDKFTGNLTGKNCNFNEKAIRIRANYDLSNFSKVVAYGDSKGDQAMFDMADEHFFRPFN